MKKLYMGVLGITPSIKGPCEEGIPVTRKGKVPSQENRTIWRRNEEITVAGNGSCCLSRKSEVRVWKVMSVNIKWFCCEGVIGTRKIVESNDRKLKMIMWRRDHRYKGSKEWLFWIVGIREEERSHLKETLWRGSVTLGIYTYLIIIFNCWH